MKAQTLEHRLRQAVPPAPDMEARLRTRRAALAEFARVHAQRDAGARDADAGDGSVRSGGAATPGRVGAGRRREKRSLWPLAWPLNGVWLGGVATACVVVIGVSVVWLMPPRDRAIQFNVSIAPSKESEPTAPQASPAPLQTSSPPASAQATSPPASAQASPPWAKAEGKLGPLVTAIAPSPSAAPETPAAPGTSAAPENLAAPAPSAEPAPAEVAPLPDDRQQIAPTPPTRERLAIAPAPPPPPAPVSAGARTQPEPSATAGPKDLEKPTATGPLDLQRQAYNSPGATSAATSDSGLDEAVVAGPPQKRALLAARASLPGAPLLPGAPPTEAERDKFQRFDTNPVKRVANEPISTFSVDVDTASYSFVRRKLNEGVLPQPDAVRVEEMINYFDYGWPASDSREQPFKPTITVSDSPWGGGKKLIHIGIKGYALPVSQQPDVNLVLLLDVSGSMDSPDKLPLAQRSMALLLESLRPTDTVAIVVYAGAAGQVLAPTPVREKETILHALSSLQPGGSTAGAAGIQLAYALAEKSFRKGGVNRILLATDGDFNVGITDQNELKGFVAREREKGVYLSVLGFGEGNYRDEMAQALAQNGNGVAAYIDTLNEAKKVLVQEATSSLFPIAKDVKLQVEFNPATVAEYRLVGYETRALNREDFNNDKVDAGDVGSGHTVTAIYEITPVGSDATLIDESRYAAREPKPAARGKANEYGFLKIRYKLPDASRSRLLEQPILVDAGVPAALRDDVAFATAVAGFAQILRGSQYVGSLSYEDVIKQAQAGVGQDRYGYRSELVQLVSKAQRARSL